jgi:hypothetical protein
MSHVYWELLSIFMEVAAFFLVTVELLELFAKGQLANYDSKFEGVLGRVKIFREKGDQEFFLNPFVYLMYVVFFLGAYFIRLHMSAPLSSNPLVEISWAVTYYGLIWPFLVLVPIMTFMIAIHFLVQAALYVLNKWHLKGALLISGAVLFVCAKGILAMIAVVEGHLFEPLNAIILVD